MKCLHPLTLYYRLIPGEKSSPTVAYDAPCGKCIWCQKRKQKEWVIRMQEELKVSDLALFVTLTYDDEHIPIENDIPCVDKRDVQLYLKRLRKSISPYFTVRYFLCSEYGMKTFRPHYHAVLFFRLNSVYSSEWRDSYLSLLSKEVVDKWQQGFCYVGTCTPQSISYVAKYVVKPKEYENLPTWILVSRNPGLGVNYCQDEKNIEFHSSDIERHKYYRNKFGGKQSLPRYYVNKLYQRPADRAATLLSLRRLNQLVAKAFDDEYRRFICKPSRRTCTRSEFARIREEQLRINGDLELIKLYKKCKL